MKAIVAGFPKTGTTSMSAALAELGYKVYDFPEHFWYAGAMWSDLLSHGQSLEEFKKAYDDVDAVCDVPACFFWDDFVKVFPDAKVILTRRENEDVWFKSMTNQLKANNENWILRACYILSWTGYKLACFQSEIGCVVFGLKYRRTPIHACFPHRLSERLAKKVYRRHNSYVLQCAPKDRFLDYNVKDGWGPLCEFLGEEVPDTPFPHKNIGGSAVEEMMKNQPAFKQIGHEMKLTITALMGLLTYIIYVVLTCFFS